MKLRTCSIALLATLAAAAPATQKTAPQKAAPQKLAPELVYRTVDHARGAISAARGRVVVVLFFEVGDGRGLEAVRDEFESLEGLGVFAVGVCVGGTAEQVRPVLREKRVWFPVHVDDKTKAVGVAKQWGVTAYPWCVIVDPDGKVAWAGDPGEVGVKLREVIKATPPRVADKGSLTLAMDLLGMAEEKLNEGKPRSAARYMARLPEETRKDPAVAERLAALTTSLEGALPEVFKLAEGAFEGGKIARAVLMLEQAAAALKETPGEGKALDELHSYTDDPEHKTEIEAGRGAAVAEDLLETGAEAEARGDEVGAFKVYRRVMDEHGVTAGAGGAVAEAEARLKRLESTPEKRRKLRDAMYGKEADALLSQAESYAKSNLGEKAKGFYRELVKKYPGTTAAEKGERALGEGK